MVADAVGSAFNFILCRSRSLASSGLPNSRYMHPMFSRANAFLGLAKLAARNSKSASVYLPCICKRAPNSLCASQFVWGESHRTAEIILRHLPLVEIRIELSLPYERLRVGWIKSQGSLH